MVVGWGIPAALISICVGFKYEEYGGEVYFPSLLRVNVFPLLLTVEYFIRIEYLIKYLVIVSLLDQYRFESFLHSTSADSYLSDTDFRYY